jgi:ubiquilin
MDEINLSIKCANSEKLTVVCEKSSTVLDLKKIIASKTDVSADNQRLIYKGRILKDESTMEQYGLKIFLSLF